MARSGVTREQVFEAADALALEGTSPTVMSVRTRLGGGSPNTITPLLAEWRALHEQKQAASQPAPPEAVEAVLRQVWGVAWKEAQAQLEGERERLAAARKEIETERAEMLAEITRLDTELEAAKETIQKRDEALAEERHAHEQAKSQAREAKVLVDERAGRITALEAELSQERKDHGQTQAALTDLRVEAASLSERAAHVDELRALVRSLQGQQGGAERQRRDKPEGSA